MKYGVVTIILNNFLLEYFVVHDNAAFISRFLQNFQWKFLRQMFVTRGNERDDYFLMHNTEVVSKIHQNTKKICRQIIHIPTRINDWPWQFQETKIIPRKRLIKIIDNNMRSINTSKELPKHLNLIEINK